MVNDQSGPWLLALGALVLGVVAVARLVGQQRDDGDGTTRRGGDGEE